MECLAEPLHLSGQVVRSRVPWREDAISRVWVYLELFSGPVLPQGLREHIFPDDGRLVGKVVDKAFAVRSKQIHKPLVVGCNSVDQALQHAQGMQTLNMSLHDL